RRPWRRLAREPGLARRRHHGRLRAAGRRRHPPPSPVGRGRPVLGRSAPRSRRGLSRAPGSRVPQRAAALRRGPGGVARRLDLLLLHQPVDDALLCRRRVGALREEAAGAALSSDAVHAVGWRCRSDAADRLLVLPAHREPRRPVRRADRRAVRRGLHRARTDRAPQSLPEALVRIGIVCYATIGGSGVVATELAHALAYRGHDIHLISAELPFRWRWGTPGLTFERVDTPSYPLFNEPQYLLALTNTLVKVSRRHKLDIIHAHYAVPHATAAYLAHDILAAESRRPPKTVTTLHGTDITLVGSDPSFASVVAFSIESSDGVTAVSESLRRDTSTALGVRRDIAVVPNFLECSEYRRLADTSLRQRLCSQDGCDAIVMHISNFRAVKRVQAVVDIFRRIRTQVRAHLVMVGDGPDRLAAERLAAELGLSDHVDFVGEQQDVVAWLSAADLFLLPSAQESFGLAALEAMSCE